MDPAPDAATPDAIAPPPEPPPAPPSAPPSEAQAPGPGRADWIGAWTVGYGCAMLVKSVLAVVALRLVSAGARWSVAEVRIGAAETQGMEHLDGFSAALARAPVVLGAGRAPFHVAAAVCAFAAIVAGFRAMPGRGGAARAGLVAVVACVLVSAGITVAEVASIGERLAWGAEVTAAFRDLRQQADPPESLVTFLAGGGYGPALLRCVGPFVLHAAAATAIAAGLRRVVRRSTASGA